MPPQQPYYYPYPPVYQAPPPPPPKPPYQAPVSRTMTIKVMIAVGLFMILGTLGMFGLSALAKATYNSVSYRSLKTYSQKRFSLKIPSGWQAGKPQDKPGYTQIEFYDGFEEDELIDRPASLQLSITKAQYPELATRSRNGLTEARQDSLETLQHLLKDYEADLECKPSNIQDKDDQDKGTDRASHVTTLSCKKEDQELHIYARYAITRQGDQVIEILHTTPEIWQHHKDILVNSLMSVEVWP